MLSMHGTVALRIKRGGAWYRATQVTTQPGQLCEVPTSREWSQGHPKMSPGLPSPKAITFEAYV